MDAGVADAGVAEAVPDAKAVLTFDDLRAAKARFVAFRLGGFALADAGAVSAPLLSALLRRPLPRKVFMFYETLLQSRGHSAGLSLAWDRGREGETSVISARSPHESTADLMELLVAVALMIDGDEDDRLTFIFEQFDLDGSGKLGRESLFALFESMARSLARLQLSMPFDRYFIDDVARSALMHAAWVPPPPPPPDSSDDDDEGSAVDKRKEARLDYEAEFAVAAAPPLSLADFLRWAHENALAQRLRGVADLAHREARLLKSWTLRAAALRERFARDSKKPPWCLSAVGAAGSNAVVAKAKAAKDVQRHVFAVAPFFVALANGEVDGPATLAVAFEVRRSAVILVHAEPRNADQGTYQRHLCQPGRLSVLPLRLARADADHVVTLGMAPEMLLMSSSASSKDRTARQPDASDELAARWRARYVWSAVLQPPPPALRVAIVGDRGELAHATDAHVIVDLTPDSSSGGGEARSDRAKVVGRASVRSASPLAYRGDGYDALPLHVLPCAVAGFSSFDEGDVLRLGTLALYKMRDGSDRGPKLQNVLETSTAKKLLVIMPQPLVGVRGTASEAAASNESGNNSSAPALDDGVAFDDGVSFDDRLIARRRANGFSLCMATDIEDEAMRTVRTDTGTVLGSVAAAAVATTQEVDGEEARLDAEAPLGAEAPLRAPFIKAPSEEVAVDSTAVLLELLLVQQAKEVLLVCASFIANATCEIELGLEGSKLCRIRQISLATVSPHPQLRWCDPLEDHGELVCSADADDANVEWKRTKLLYAPRGALAVVAMDAQGPLKVDYAFRDGLAGVSSTKAEGGRPFKASEVLSGPMVGVVSHSTAVIVIELDEATEIVLNFTPVVQLSDNSQYSADHAAIFDERLEDDNAADALHPWARSARDRAGEIPHKPRKHSVCCVVQARTPTPVVLRGLRAGTLYTYGIVGASMRQAYGGTFRTTTRWPAATTIITVRGDSFGAWADVSEPARIQAARQANVQQRLVAVGDRARRVAQLLERTEAKLEVLEPAVPAVEAPVDEKPAAGFMPSYVSKARPSAEGRGEASVEASVEAMGPSEVNALFESLARGISEDVEPEDESNCRLVAQRCRQELQALRPFLEALEAKMPSLEAKMPSQVDKRTVSGRAWDATLSAWAGRNVSACGAPSSGSLTNDNDKHAESESGAAAHLVRDATSARPDADVVVIVGGVVGGDVVRKVREMLTKQLRERDCGVGPKRRDDDSRRCAAVEYAKERVRAALRQPAARAVLAHQSTVLLESLPDLYDGFARCGRSGDDLGAYDAALVVLDVLRSYSAALRGEKVDDDADVDSAADAVGYDEMAYGACRSTAHDRRTEVDYAALKLATRDCGSTMLRHGRVGLVLLKVASLSRSSTDRLAPETAKWLRGALSLDIDDDLESDTSAFSGDAAEIKIYFSTPLMNTLIVVSDLPLAASEGGAERAVLAMLTEWRKRAAPGAQRVFEIVSHGGATSKAPPLLQRRKDDAPLELLLPPLVGRPHGECGFGLLRCVAHPLEPHVSATLEPRKEAPPQSFARLSVGPVVGEMTATTARVLVEASAHATLWLAYRVAGRLDNAAMRLRLDALPHSPTTFFIAGLKADCLYEFAIAAAEPSFQAPEDMFLPGTVQRKHFGADDGTVNRLSDWGTEDDSRREGLFRTLASRPSLFRICAVRGALLDPGWLRQVCDEDKPNFFAEACCDASLRKRPATLASAVCSAAASRELDELYPWALLSREASLPKRASAIFVHFSGPWRSFTFDERSIAVSTRDGATRSHLIKVPTRDGATRSQLAERLRDEYRLALSLPLFRDVCRHATHIFCAAPPSVAFSHAKAANSRRLAKRRKSRAAAKTAETDDVYLSSSDEELANVESDDDDDEATAQKDAALRIAREYQGALLVCAQGGDDAVSLNYLDEAAAIRIAADDEPARPPPRRRPSRAADAGKRQPATSHFRRHGGVGLLFLDTPPPAATLDLALYGRPRISKASNRAFAPLRTSQWALIDAALRCEDVVAMVICCDRALLPEPELEASREAAFDADALRLMDALCRWLRDETQLPLRLQGAQKRTALLLCAAGKWGSRTNIHDRETHVRFEQVAVGAVPSRPLRLGTARGSLGRYDFEFALAGSNTVPQRHGRDFCSKEPPLPLKGRFREVRHLAPAPPAAEYDSRTADGDDAPLDGLGDVAARPAFAVATILADATTARIDTLHRPCDEATLRPDEATLCPPRLVVGPVLGLPAITAYAKHAGLRCTQRILFEVDAAVEVTVSMEDTASGEVFLSKAHISANEFRAVSVEDLRLGRRYAVRVIARGFDLVSGRPANDDGGLASPADDLKLFADAMASSRRGCFQDRSQCYCHTLEKSGAELNILVTSGHRPSQVDTGGDAMADVSERLSSPWHGIDLHLCIGGRQAVSAAVVDCALYLRKMQRVADALELKKVHERIKQRFRDEYRAAYGAPAMRAALAGCPTVMTGCTLSLLHDADAFPKPGESASRDEWRSLVSTVVSLGRQVAVEYEIQLHSDFEAERQRREYERVDDDVHLLTYLDGTVAVAALDVGSCQCEANFAKGFENGSRADAKVFTRRNKATLDRALKLADVAVLIVVLECAAWRPRPAGAKDLLHKGDEGFEADEETRAADGDAASEADEGGGAVEDQASPDEEDPRTAQQRLREMQAEQGWTPGMAIAKGGEDEEEGPVKRQALKPQRFELRPKDVRWLFEKLAQWQRQKGTIRQCKVVCGSGGGELAWGGGLHTSVIVKGAGAKSVGGPRGDSAPIDQYVIGPATARPLRSASAFPPEEEELPAETPAAAKQREAREAAARRAASLKKSAPAVEEVADKEEEVLYDRAGAFGSLGFEHVSEVPQRHYGVLLIGSERLLAGQGTKKAVQAAFALRNLVDVPRAGRLY
ncbi:hypothetical protein M885DRAFT_24104 [Pelagophyceae sp. CCMP2097]|nr:hypothetical protein M885DRAFT_24104 [Pelagophyceae sp. CCMP2097]